MKKRFLKNLVENHTKSCIFSKWKPDRINRMLNFLSHIGTRNTRVCRPLLCKTQKCSASTTIAHVQQCLCLEAYHRDIIMLREVFASTYTLKTIKLLSWLARTYCLRETPLIIYVTNVDFQSFNNHIWKIDQCKYDKISMRLCIN